MSQSFRLFKELIFRLTPQELLQLRKKLEPTIELIDKNKNKSKKLLNLVLKQPALSQKEVEKEIYGAYNKIAFEKLIDRANEKIDEVLINFHRDATTIYSERNFYFFYLKRKLLVIQMRIIRGIDFNFRIQVEKIISIAKEYELYDIMIEALHAKQRHSVLRNKSAIKQIQKLIDRYEDIRRKVQTVRNIWTNLGVPLSRTVMADNYKNELSDGRNILKKYYEETLSNTIGYYYYFLETFSKQEQENYHEAEVCLKKLLNLTLNNKSVYTTARHGEVLINIAHNYFLLGDFKNAILNSIKAKNNFKINSINFYIATEVEFLSRYYNGELSFAEELINEVYNFCHNNGGPFLNSKYAYLFACIKTLKGDIEKSNELLLEVKEIEKDKGGWNLGKRMLTIINRIEAGDLESVDLKVLSLEKFVKRISKANYVRKRDKIILRILLKLINERFDFNKVYKQRKKYFDLLESSDPDYTWKIKSPELIVFHEWFKRKMKIKEKKEVLI